MRTKKIYYKAIGILLVVLLAALLMRASETKEGKERRLREAKIRENTSANFVVIHYYFKKSERPKTTDEDDYAEQEVLRKILAKRTQDAVGIIISEEGEIFTADNYLRPDVVDKITVTGVDGRTLGAQAGRILVKARGQIIRITEPLPKTWKALKFVAPPEVLDAKFKLYGASLRINTGDVFFEGGGDEEEYICVNRITPVMKRNNQSDVPDYFSVVGHHGATIVCDAEGAALGVTAHDKLEKGSSALVWRGSDILTDAGIKRATGQKQAEKQFSKYLYQVRITFRPPPKEDEEYDMGMYSRFWGRFYAGDEDDEKEMFVYGLAIEPDKLILPIVMSQAVVAGIDTISVKVVDNYFEASFSGVLRQCEATVLQLGEPKLEHVVTVDTQVSLRRGEPFWTVFARELAGKDLVIDYNRWFRKVKGYENKLYRKVDNDIKNGSWLVDKQGRFAGLYTPARREYQRIMPYLMGEGGDYFDFNFRSFGRMMHFSRGRYQSSDDEDMQIFDTGSLASIVKDLPANYDEHIRHTTKDEQKRRAWIGVEFTGVSKEMAKQLDLRRQTEDGRIGLMVNRVYPNSPASKMGLAEGDVLLKLKVRKAPWPIELKFERDYDHDGPDWEDMDIPDEFEAMGFQMPRKRPWPGRDNFFTQMLKVIGEGVPVELIYLHEDKELKKEFVIEQSPRDALSAKKYKDKKLGITVKNLTYEVRTALKLAENAKAIVVSKVEPGTPAALARINTFELIRAVDGQDVGSVDEFEAAIKKAKEEGKKSVRVTVEWMGKTRLADLKFEAKDGKLRDMMRLIPGFPSGGG